MHCFNDSSIYVPTASSTLLFLSSVVGSLQGSLVRRKARPNQIGGMLISTLTEPNQMKLGFVITNDKASYVAKEDSICLFSIAEEAALNKKLIKPCVPFG